MIYDEELKRIQDEQHEGTGSLQEPRTENFLAEGEAYASLNARRDDFWDTKGDSVDMEVHDPSATNTGAAAMQANDYTLPPNDEDYHDVQAEKKVSWKTTWQMLKTPSVGLTLLQAAPSALPFGFASVFLNDYLAHDRGLTVEEATGVLIMFGAGNAIGVMVGGILGHYGYKRDVRYPPAIMGSTLMLGVVLTYFLINWVDGDSSVGAVTIIGLMAGVLVVIPVPLERAILTNVTVPETRGRANSFLSILDDLGKGLGPAIVAVLIQAFKRPMAFSISLLGWIVGGFISFVTCCFVKRDEELTQERVLKGLLREQVLADCNSQEDLERED